MEMHSKSFLGEDESRSISQPQAHEHSSTPPQVAPADALDPNIIYICGRPMPDLECALQHIHLLDSQPLHFNYDKDYDWDFTPVLAQLFRGHSFNAIIKFTAASIHHLDELRYPLKVEGSYGVRRYSTELAFHNFFKPLDEAYFAEHGLDRECILRQWDWTYTVEIPVARYKKRLQKLSNKINELWPENWIQILELEHAHKYSHEMPHVFLKRCHNLAKLYKHIEDCKIALKLTGKDQYTAVLYLLRSEIHKKRESVEPQTNNNEQQYIADMVSHIVKSIQEKDAEISSLKHNVALLTARLGDCQKSLRNIDVTITPRESEKQKRSRTCGIWKEKSSSRLPLRRSKRINALYQK